MSSWTMTRCRECNGEHEECETCEGSGQERWCMRCGGNETKESRNVISGAVIWICAGCN